MLKRSVVYLIIVSVIAVSSFVFAQQAASTKASSTAKIPVSTSTSQKSTRARRPTLSVEELEKQLNLTSDQQARIFEIRFKARQQTTEIMREARRKTGSIINKAVDEIESALNDEQKKKFKELREKYALHLNLRSADRKAAGDSKKPSQSSPSGSKGTPEK